MYSSSIESIFQFWIENGQEYQWREWDLTLIAQQDREEKNIHRVPSTSKTMPSSLGAWLVDFVSEFRAANRRGSWARFRLMIVNVRFDEPKMCNFGRQTACKVVGRKDLNTGINRYNQYVRCYPWGYRFEEWKRHNDRWPMTELIAVEPRLGIRR